MSRRARIVVGAMLGAWLLAVGVLALWPSSPDSDLSPLVLQLLLWARGQSWLPALDYATLDFAANLAVFVPIGVLVGLLLKRTWWPLAVLIGADLAMVVEIVQLAANGRPPSWTDVVASAIGAAFGALAQTVVPRPLERRRPTPGPLLTQPA